MFHRPLVAIETIALLVSSFVCGLAMIAAKRKNLTWTLGWLFITGLLGFLFLFIELYEFAWMIHEGAGPQRSAFLSAFFTLVGCHGAHVTCGLIWIGTMMAQIWAKGFQPHIVRRLLCLSIFWHALDIIWVGNLHYRLSDRDIAMTEHEPEPINVAPGEPHDRYAERNGAMSSGWACVAADRRFLLGRFDGALWGPGVAVGLVVLAIAQMGVHLVFFLHITSGPDNTNNVLALAFGVLIVFLVMVGTIWIMAHMNATWAASRS